MLTEMRSALRPFTAGIVAVALTASTLVATPPAARAQTLPVASQGAGVLIGNMGCTLGFTNPHTRSSYIAAHCGEYSGQPVALVTANKELIPNAGWFYPSARYNAADPLFSNDWAEIKWHPDVVMGANNFSGDQYIAPTQLERGDRICFHGQSSHPDGRSASCSEYVDRVGNAILYSGTYPIPGDSGGPVWLERGGSRYFVGVNSGFYYAGQYQLGRAAFPADSVAVTEPALWRIFMDYYSDQIYRPGQQLQGNIPDPNKSKDGVMQSSAGTEEIIAAVVSVVAALLTLAGVAWNFLR